ncbi:Integrin beta-5 [Thelohanellus kitauei]|uniref:Integrin beta-5 n=1 Tax=Thelohanellus kitauei TaxID=669202 RepID=A0A0C2NCG6_THEKT|nr:Integrin beta-5 [Thelohanellus kitauei]
MITSSYVKVNSFYDVEVEIIFDWICPCQAQSRGVTPQPKCSSHGQVICGKCDCDPGWEGDKCQFQKGESSESSNDAECTSNEDCGQSGKCICNKCQCPESPEQFYGPGCTCSDLLCPYTQKGLCNCDFIYLATAKVPVNVEPVNAIQDLLKKIAQGSLRT